MSRLGSTFTDHPISIPAELAAAWDWMEQQGYGGGPDDDPYLTAYPGERVLGPVFRNPGASGWFEAGSEAEKQILVIADIAGDGSTAALWRDDGGALRVVGLGSEGDAYLLAGSVLDFLRLVGVGYAEISRLTLGSEPDNDHLDPDEDPVTATAAFRAWLGESYGVQTPSAWPAVGEDEFTAWVRHQLGEPEPTVPEPAGELPAWPGDIQVILRAMLAKEDSPEVAAFVDLLGIKLRAGGLRASGKALDSVQVEVETRYKKLTTVWIRPRWPRDGSDGLRLDRLIAGLPAVPGLEQVRELLGDPTHQRLDRFRWLRYDTERVQVHFEFTGLDDERPDACRQVTVMTDRAGDG